MALWFSSANMSSIELLEPLLDLFWHYDCVLKPSSILSSDLRNQIIYPLLNIQPSASESEGGVPPTICSSWTCRCNDFNTKDNEEARNAQAAACKANISCRTNSSNATSFDPLANSSLANNSRDDDDSTCWLRGVFNIFDENGDGRITKDELRRSLQKLGIETTDESILSLFGTTELKVDRLDVDMDEFLLLYKSTNMINDSTCSTKDYTDVEVENHDEDEYLLEAFSIFDKNKDGFISAEELQSVLCGLGFRKAQKLEACVEMIKSVDQNGDGRVDFWEFKTMLKYPSRRFLADA